LLQHPVAPEAAVVPLVLLVLAGLGGVLRIEDALRMGVGVSVITLGLFALLATRRTKPAGWKRLLILAALIGLGALVVLLKTLAHRARVLRSSADPPGPGSRWTEPHERALRD
jgi:hypothetical protein